MKKYLIASHGMLASGAFDSLKLFLGDIENVSVLSAYIDDSDFSLKIYAFMKDLNTDDQGIIFTDIYGGSVNQKVTAIISESEKEVYVIAGFNLPVLLEVLTSTDKVSKERLEEIVHNSRVQVITKSSLTDLEDSAGDEDFFD